MFIFHCGEFTLGGSSVLTCHYLGKHVVTVKLFVQAVGGTDGALMGSRLTILIQPRVIKWSSYDDEALETYFVEF